MKSPDRAEGCFAPVPHRHRGGARRSLAVCLLAVAAIIVLPAVAQAETLTNAGKEFWLGFSANCIECGSSVQTLYITGNTATTGTVTIAGLGFSEGFSVTPGKVTPVRLPAGTEMFTSDGIEEKAIHVTAGAPVVVYGLNDQPYTTDAYTGLPTTVIGTSYTVLAFGYGLGGNSEIAVVAGQNGTEVTITPSVNGGEFDTRPAGVPYTVTLNKGEEYQLRATTNPEDLTGTKITSTAPVSVYGGEQCANIPTNGYYACDYIVEQNVPDDAWGTSFLTEPLKTRHNGDYFELVADQPGTEVKLNGTLVAKLNAGEHYSQEVEVPSEWTSNKPIELSQDSNSSTYDGTTGDPSMMIIPPYQQFETGYTITTPYESETVFENYVNLVVPKSAVGLVAIDGVDVPASEYNAIGSSNFEGVQVDLTPGSHVITGNGQPFGVFSYGFSSYNAYSYYGGMSLAPVAEVEHVTLAPAKETATVGTKHCVTATVTDQEGNPLGGVRVDFVVTGANSAKESVFAGSNGQAKFCYTGTNVGKDTITGSVGLISGTAQKTWVGLSGVMSGEGRLTWEGSRVADFAFILGCHPTDPKPRLEVLLGGKAYVLSSESTNLCTLQPSPEPPPEAGAKFNTMEGSGPATGGTVITWKFLDGGVGGTNDLSSIKLTKGATVLFKAGPATPGSFGGGTRQGRNTALPPGEY